MKPPVSLFILLFTQYVLKFLIFPVQIIFINCIASFKKPH